MELRPKIEKADYPKRRIAYLEKIFKCVLEGDRKKAIKSGPDGFRTFLDSWYAYHRAGRFLNGRGYDQWFNRGDLRQERHRKTMRESSDSIFISVDAWEVLQGTKDGVDLVKDHAVPVSALYDELIALKPKTIVDVEQHLLERYQLGIITQEENTRLNAKFRFKMPCGDRSIYARYNHSDVTIIRFERRTVSK